MCSPSMTDKPCTDNAPPLTEDQVFQLDFITKGTHVSAKALRRHTQCLQSIRGEEFEKIPGSKKHWQAYKCKKCEGHLRVQKSDKTKPFDGSGALPCAAPDIVRRQIRDQYSVPFLPEFRRRTTISGFM